MWAQRRILGVRWQDMIKNVNHLCEKRGLPLISVSYQQTSPGPLWKTCSQTNRGCACKQSSVKILLKVWTALQLRSGCCPSPSWRPPRSRPRDTWINPLMQSDTPLLQQWERVQSGVAMGCWVQTRLPPDK